ncbi:MAG: Mu-like prophage major head subunit gpT family protein [Pseudomonadota bacterium]|nr:Mu-like prophage major head subunit gpT family protein [Pseudomonadota bacterium]
MNRAASVVPSSFDERDNSFEVVWSTGARRTMLRWDGWDPVEVDEELVIDRKSVRLGRLNASAPFLADHRQSVDSVVGSVVPATARLEGGQGVARIRLAETPGTAETVAKIKAGHLRNVSVGYIVHTYEVTENAGERPLYRATDWEPMEISIVPIPADAGAQIRSMKGNEMPVEDEVLEGRQAPAIINGAAIRGSMVRKFAQDAGLTSDQTLGLLEEHDAKPFTRNGALDRVLEIRAAQDAPPVNGRHSGQIVRDQGCLLNSRLADALYAKLARKAPADHAREFMGASLGTMARLLLEQRGERTGMMNDRQVIERSMSGFHTTGDFPELLLGAGNRFLQESFEVARSPLLRVSKIRTVGDFREIKVLQLSGFSGLEPLSEHGEFKNGTFTEGKESYTIGTFGKIFGITRNAIINDDLGAFSDPLSKMARAAAEVEAQQLAALLLQNSGNGPTMGDGNALFHTDHGNKAASGTVIDVANLSAGRAAMRVQKEVNSDEPINAAAKYMLVGAAKETQAEQVLASLSPATVSDVNPFSGKLELLVEPRFTGNSWRLFADPTLAPVIEAAYLEGREVPTLETKEGWRTLGAEFRVHFDFGCGAVDHRGAYLNPGA